MKMCGCAYVDRCILSGLIYHAQASQNIDRLLWRPSKQCEGNALQICRPNFVIIEEPWPLQLTVIDQSSVHRLSLCCLITLLHATCHASTNLLTYPLRWHLQGRLQRFVVCIVQKAAAAHHPSLKVPAATAAIVNAAAAALGMPAFAVNDLVAAAL